MTEGATVKAKAPKAKAKVKAAPAAKQAKVHAIVNAAKVAAKTKAKNNLKSGKSSSSLQTFKKPAANGNCGEEKGCFHTIVCVCVTSNGMCASIDII